MIVLMMGTFTMLSAAAEPEPAFVTINEDSVTIGNGYLSRTWALSAGKMYTSAIANLRTGNTLIPGAGSENFMVTVTDEFVMNVDATIPARQIKSSELTLAGAPVATKIAGGYKVQFTYAPAVRFDIPWTIVYTVELLDDQYYMHSWLEVGVPEANRAGAYLHTIDMENFNIGQSIPDVNLFCRRDHKQMLTYSQYISYFQESSGTPLYVNGLFFGIEFQLTSNDIIPFPNAAAANQDKFTRLRYYSGKDFTRLASEGRLNEAGRFTTWTAVLGAASGADYDTIQSDFFDYVDTIAQGTHFRTQFDTWYDGGMTITPASLTNSFMSLEQGLTQAGLPPIASYTIDDGYNDYSAPFWGFKPAFANNVLKDISTMVQDAGGGFAKWISPRGSYGQSQSPFMQAAGTGFRNVSAFTDRGPNTAPTTTFRGEVCAAAPVYVANLLENMCWNQEEYGVNYWKLDGMARSVCHDPRHGHMVGGVVAGSRNTWANVIGTDGEGSDADASSMWFFTELWESYNKLFLGLRANDPDHFVWLNSTGTSVASPWYLMIVNSMKVVTSPDSGKAGATRFTTEFGGGTVGDGARRLTFRDGGYWRFFNFTRVQFPMHYIWNHDPIYALGNSYVEMTPQDLRGNLYGNAMRANRIWELLFSPSVFTDAHWLVTNETMSFGRENMETLARVRMITDPRYNNGVMGSPTGQQGSLGDLDSNWTPYMMSAWDEEQGFVQFRNPLAGERVTLTLVLDKTAGVKAGMKDFYLTYVLPSVKDGGQVQNRKETYSYGDTIVVNLMPMEQVIVSFKKAKDVTPPELVKTETRDANTIRISFNEAVELASIPATVSGNTVVNAVVTADSRAVDLTLGAPLADGVAVSLSVSVEDLSGNAATLSGDARYAAGRIVAQFETAADLTAGADVEYSDLLEGNVLILNGNTTAFTNGASADQSQRLSVASMIRTTSSGAVIIEQAGAFKISVNAAGKIEFSVNGLTVESKQAINDGAWHHFAVVKEPNEMIKVYIDGLISASTYEGYKLCILEAGNITIGSAGFKGELAYTTVFNKSLGYRDIGELASLPLSEYGVAGANTFTVVGLKPSFPGTVQARYDNTGYYRQTGSMPGASARSRFEFIKYYRNQTAVWYAADVDVSEPGKTPISGVMPGLDGAPIGGRVSVISEWPRAWSLQGTDLSAYLDEMVEGGWEILGRNDANLNIGNSGNSAGLRILATKGKIFRGHIDPYDPTGTRVLDGSPNPDYDPNSSPYWNVNHTNAMREFLENVQNENFFLIDPGMDDFTVSITANINASQLNNTAGLIIRTSDDDYVRMSYCVPGATGNGATAAMSLNMHVGGEELTLEEYPASRITLDTQWVDLAITKEGDYYTGFYRTQDTNNAWMKVGTVKAEMVDPKVGFYAAQGASNLPEHGWTLNTAATSRFQPRFRNFNFLQYSPNLTIAAGTAGVVDVEAGYDSPRYGWVDTVFSDGRKAAVLVELPVVDTSVVNAAYQVNGVIAGSAQTVPVTINVVPSVVKASIHTESAVVVGTPATFTVSLEGMWDVNIVTLSFITSGEYLNLNLIDSYTGLNGFSIIQGPDFVNLGGNLWKGTVKLTYNGGFVKSNGALDILSISGATLKTGETTVTLTDMVVVGRDADGNSAYLPGVIVEAEATTSIVNVPPKYSKYDLNRDGAIDDLDLSIAASFYLCDETDADWETPYYNGRSAKDADVTGDGVVDMADLIEIMANYCKSYNLFT